MLFCLVCSTSYIFVGELKSFAEKAKKKIPFSQFGRELFSSNILLTLSEPGKKTVQMNDILSGNTGTGHPRGNVCFGFIVHCQRARCLEKLAERSKLVGCTVLG